MISHSHYLIGLARYLRVDAKLKAGEYQLNPGVTPDGLLEKLTQGKVIRYSFTLIEGQSFKQLMQRLQADPVLNPALGALSAEKIMSELGYSDRNPEGLFLPETYQITRGSTER